MLSCVKGAATEGDGGIVFSPSAEVQPRHLPRQRKAVRAAGCLNCEKKSRRIAAVSILCYNAPKGW